MDGWLIEDVRLHGEPAKQATLGQVAFVRPVMSPGGNIKYQAWSQARGMIATDRGYPKKFGSLKAALLALNIAQPSAPTDPQEPTP